MTSDTKRLIAAACCVSFISSQLRSLVGQPQLNDGIDNDRTAAGAERVEQLVGLRRCVELAQLADDAQRLVRETGSLDGFVIALGGGDAFLGNRDNRVGRLLQMVFAVGFVGGGLFTLGLLREYAVAECEPAGERAQGTMISSKFRCGFAMIGDSVLFHGKG